MKKATLLFYLFFCSFFTGKSQVQQFPELSLPMVKIRSVLGVEPNSDFALVYKGDTLARYASNGNTSISTIFDEEIKITNYGDSVGYEYNLPQKSGIYRINLPDSLPLYSYSYLKEPKKTSLVSYDSMGKEE